MLLAGKSAFLFEPCFHSHALTLVLYTHMPRPVISGYSIHDSNLKLQSPSQICLYNRLDVHIIPDFMRSLQHRKFTPVTSQWLIAVNHHIYPLVRNAHQSDQRELWPSDQLQEAERCWENSRRLELETFHLRHVLEKTSDRYTFQTHFYGFMNKVVWCC